MQKNMKPITKPKEFIAIIKSGITGALALTSACIILAVVANIIRVPCIAFLYAKSIAQCSLQGFFIATSGLGFILGLIIRRRLPVIQKGIAPMAVAAIPLIVGVWLLNAVSSRVEIPCQIKLADCTNGTVIIHTRIPKGRNHHLVLATPEIQMMKDGSLKSSFRFSGRIRILSNGVLTVEIPIDSDSTWLTPDGFVLTGVGFHNTNSPPLSRVIQAQKDYDIEITFHPPPSTSSSIWLYWKQAVKDRDK